MKNIIKQITNAKKLVVHFCCTNILAKIKKVNVNTSIKRINTFFNNVPILVWVLSLATLLSIIACIVFYNLGLQLSNFDALSRLNIARKVTDNLHPGLGQFGSVWPFLPQLLMVPFVAFTPFWHSGIAGMIVSVPSALFATYCIYAIILDITKSKLASALGALTFISNINILLLQTMAMSEVLFIALILATMYFLLQWLHGSSKSLLYLILAGFSVAGASLVRYEGVAFALSAIGVVSLITIIKRHSLKTTEGVAILFGTLALSGIALWCLYNAAVYKDPLYWEKIYSGQKSVISTEQKVVKKATPVKATTKQETYVQKVTVYSIAIADMAGLPLFAVGVLGIIIYLISLRPLKSQKPLIVLLPLSIVVFMLFTLYKSALPITVPPLTLHSIKNFQTNFALEYNIRYGILLLPLIVIGAYWLLSRNRVLKFVAAILFIIHLITPFDHNLFLIYQLPLSWSTNLESKNNPELPSITWFKANYTGGEILVSAFKHDATLFDLGLPYKSYIHEGTGNYWLVSQKNPRTYAKWIYISDPNNLLGGTAKGDEDPLSKKIIADPTLHTYFEEKYNDGVISIYEKRAIPLSNYKPANIQSQQELNGLVLGQNNKPIAGVLVKDDTMTTYTNNRGQFHITVPSKMTYLTFLKSGFQTQLLTLNFGEVSADNTKVILSKSSHTTIFQNLFRFL